MGCSPHTGRADFQGDGGRFASDREQFAAVDEMAGRVVGRASSRASSGNCSSRCESALTGWSGFTSAATGLSRQRRADFVTVRQVAEQRGMFFGQHAGQPMPHARQQMFAPGRALKLPLPEGLIGKDQLRALREFCRVVFWNLRAEIIPRLVQSQPRHIQRAMARLPFKRRHRRIIFLFHSRLIYHRPWDKGCPSHEDGADVSASQIFKFGYSLDRLFYKKWCIWNQQERTVFGGNSRHD